MKRRSPATFAALRSASSDADVVVAHGSTTLPVSALALAGTRQRLVYRQISDPNFWAPPGRRRLQTAVALRTTAAVVALADEAADLVASAFRYPRARVHVVPNGVPRARFAPPDAGQRAHARNAQGLSDEFCILYLGALVPEKGISVALDSVAGMERVVLLVAGDGPDRQRLEAAAEKYPPGRVRFLGAVDDPVPLLHAADVCVLPSLGGDSMPAALIEAAMCGVPSVATPVGAIADVVKDGETGLIVPIGDASRLSTAIDKLRSDPAFASGLGLAASVHAASEYEITSVARQWISVCNRTLDEHGKVI
ncbi:glycosyltransferase family 4 protein [Actinospongicola halichondriae]|uniref:glycosyltransferase family 4 protein n=1 Tax=Actinospongicola halichondriae TaxID=3236844 RepID=UPI003D47FD22